MRWSAAKGVARLADRLPKDFAGQVLETILGLFEIHFLAAASLYDLPAIAESTWHGACLACAEIARRNLVEPEHLHQLIEWLSKVRSRLASHETFPFLSVSCRPCTSTCGRVLIPLVPMFETPHRTHCGRLHGHKIIQHWYRMQII